MKNEDILDFQIFKKHLGSWIMSHGLFFWFMTDVWVNYMRYVYIMTQIFATIFMTTKILKIRLRKN